MNVAWWQPRSEPHEPPSSFTMTIRLPRGLELELSVTQHYLGEWSSCIVLGDSSDDICLTSGGSQKWPTAEEAQAEAVDIVRRFADMIIAALPTVST